MRLTRRLLSFTLCAGCVLFPAGARAADTVETWDVGATDLDFYLGAEGVGRDRWAGGVYGEIMLGYGLLPRLSAHFGVSLAGDGRLAGRTFETSFGVFGTPLDTDHLDVDVFLAFGAGLPDDEGLHVAPSFEANFDVAPDGALAGAYLRGAVLLAGPEGPGERSRADAAATLGAYWTAGPGHQLLLEVGAESPLRGQPASTTGSVALGYNVEAAEGLELINEVGVSHGFDGEAPEVSVMIGFIATMTGEP